jgi:Ca2+-binding RTX toxin-like protein
MPTVKNFNAIFDGVTPVPTPNGGVSNWYGGRMGYYDGWYSGPEDRFVATADLTGSNWQIKAWRMASDDSKTIISDLDNGAGRRIDFLELGWNSVVDLTSTRVLHIFGWDGNKHVVTLGDQQVGPTFSISLYALQNIVTTGNAWVKMIETDGQDTITIGTGGAGLVSTGNGGATITTIGYAESVWNGNGDDSVSIGGGAASVRTGGGDDVINVTGANAVDLIVAGSGNDLVDTGDGGAGYVSTQNGDDTVIGGNGYVTTIHAGSGDDLVRLGSGGTGFVRLGDGNDRVVLEETDPDYAVVLQGGAGIDTLDFSRFGTGVVFSLDEGGAYQNPGAPGGDPNVPASGYFSEALFENIIGTTSADKLTGDAADNLLEGGGGNDTLVGLDGNDTLLGGWRKDKLVGGNGDDVLAGGQHNDLLVGGNGADVFEFGPKGGKDKVKDFEQGTDILRLDGHVGGFASLVISDKGAHRMIDYDGGTILLAGHAGLVLDAGDFDFI